MSSFAQSLASHSLENTKRDIDLARTKARNDLERDMLHDYSHDIVNKGKLTKPQREVLNKILTRPGPPPQAPPLMSPALHHLSDCVEALERQHASPQLIKDVHHLMNKADFVDSKAIDIACEYVQEKHKEEWLRLLMPLLSPWAV
jgi:hypothetical protein